MTQTEKRLLSLAELIGAYMDYKEEGNDIVTEALEDKMLKDSLSIQTEFQKKTETDGRKNPVRSSGVKKPVQPHPSEV